MDDIPDKNDNNEVLEADIITPKNENRPAWMRVLFFCGNKLLYALLNVVVYFTNRGIFALKAIATFNFILIGFVFGEWWLYQYLFSEFIPEMFNNFQSKYYPIQQTEGE